MAEVIGVRFKEVGKVYYFDPLDNKLSTGDKVIVETARGLECGEVAMPNKDIDEKELNHPLKPLVRIATKDDLRRVEENRKKEKSAHKICEEKIAKHKLVMKLVNVEYTFDNSKIIFSTRQRCSAVWESAADPSAAAASWASSSPFQSRWLRNRDFRSHRQKSRAPAAD